ncbi:MAG TPA: glycosyltransferase family 39 protein [Acidimicrobiia bacterium]|nr:glycosyltransferase family 39 protein [Acidimicrobiia bacterium]
MRSPSLISFAAGLAASAATTVLVMMAALSAGLIDRPHLLVPVAGLIAFGVAAAAAQRHVASIPFRIGSLSGAAAASFAEMWSSTTGVGALQLIAVASAIVVAVWGPRLLTPLTRPIPGLLVLIGLIALAAVFVRIVVAGGELGHDEAAYALKARAWFDGTPDTGWSLHRGVGQSVLAAAILPFGQSAAALRVVSVVLSLGTVVAVYGLGRAIRSNRAGLIAAGVFAVAPSFLRRGAEFLTDVPSTGLLLVVATLLWRWLTQTPPKPSTLYFAAGVAAASIYVRYQAILSLGLLVLALLVVGWDRVRLHSASVLKAAGVGLALLVPHFIHATVSAGVPWGIFLATADAGGREYLGEGIVDYVRDFPDLLAGPLGAVAIIVGLTWTGWRILSNGDRKPALFLAIPALGQFLLLGLVSHGEPRFVFFPVALLLVAAGIAAEDLRAAISRPLYRTLAWSAAAAVVISLGIQGDRVDDNAEARAESIEALVETARVVRQEADGPCGIVTGLEPQLTWLSGCATQRYYRDGKLLRFDGGVDVFLMLADEAPRQPTGDWLQSYLALAEEEPVVVESEGSFGNIEVWQAGD